MVALPGNLKFWQRNPSKMKLQHTRTKKQRQWKRQTSSISAQISEQRQYSDRQNIQEIE